MSREPRLHVDGRWAGRHGIARFGREVVSRLSTPHVRLGGPADPLSPVDLINPRRVVLRRRDVVYSPGFNAGATAARQLLTLHDLIHLTDPNERDGRKSFYYEHVVRPAVLRTGRVLTVSSVSRDAIRSWLDDAVPVIDVGNGCSDVFFDQTPHAERSGVLYVGNLKPHKNPETAFGAVAANKTTRLTVVTSDVRSAAELAARAGIAERTTIRSDVSDVELAALYGSARALVFPSLDEGFGLPAAEALAMGCPVLHWAGCASIAEIVGMDGVALEDATAVQTWADAIADIETRDRDVSARARLQSHYSWTAVAARVDVELTELLGT